MANVLSTDENALTKFKVQPIDRATPVQVTIQPATGGSVDASAVTYSPAVPGNWAPPPTQVAQALDELAARPSGGSVTSVSGTAPITSTGGTTPAIGITPATTLVAGSLSAADKTKLDSLPSGPVVTSVSGTAPIMSSGGTTPAIAINPATTSTAGSMSATDKTKLDSLPSGPVVTSVTGSAPITSSGGSTPAVGITAATPSAAGSMSAADKTKLDSLPSGPVVTSVTGSAPITSSGGSTPAVGITAATPSAAGSMSAADKTKLDGLPGTLGTAPGVTYTPSVPAFWGPTPPTNVQQALDALADPNGAQTTNAAQLGPATVNTLVSSNFTTEATALCLVIGTMSGTNVNSSATHTMTLGRDGTPGTILDTKESGSAVSNGPWQVVCIAVVQLTQGTHTFTIQTTSSSGNDTVPIGFAKICVIEL